MADPRGLSLLEVLVVVALGATLAGIGVLNYQAMRPGLDLSVAVRQVVMDLKAARMRAIAENVNRRVVFAVGAERYQHQRKTGSAYLDDGGPVALPHGVTVSDCTAAEDGISFRPRGNAANFGTVTVRNGNGDLRRIVVDIAGQVRVQQ